MVNAKPPTVCFFTATRAEYGLLRPLIRWGDANGAWTRQILCSGAHLSPEFGLTWRQIEADGFPIDEKVEILLSSDSGVGVGKSMGLAVGGFTEALARLQPDLVVLLGDRYELLAAAAAAAVLNIPVAHLHGGEITEGAIDELFRHAVTKLSHLHFASTASYHNRIVQMGEAPDRVHTVGAIGLDDIHGVALQDRATMVQACQLPTDGPYFLITYHPETVAGGDFQSEIDVLMSSLLEFDPKVNLLVTGANADAGGRLINKRLEEWQTRHRERISFHINLGQLRYLSAMKHCQAVVGNSSSGIIEAPAFKVPTINIGDRQKGRIRADSVLQSTLDAESLKAALKKATSREFIATLPSMSNPYGAGDTAARIGTKIIEHLRQGKLLEKHFHDFHASNTNTFQA